MTTEFSGTFIPQPAPEVRVKYLKLKDDSRLLFPLENSRHVSTYSDGDSSHGRYGGNKRAPTGTGSNSSGSSSFTLT